MENKIVQGIRPERLYSMTELENKDDLRIGDVIAVILDYYDSESNRLSVTISPQLHGFIQFDNFFYPPLSLTDNAEYHNLPKEVNSTFSKKITAQIVAFHEDGSIELDRRIVMQSAYEKLVNSIGSIVEATVENIHNSGIFVDIGNGVRSLIREKECSSAKYSPFSDFFRIGQIIPKVKILSFDSQTNRFNLSIKRAYERQVLKPYTSERVKVLGTIPGGRFVEIDPGNVGIMDVDENTPMLEQGSYVWVCIRKITPKGFRCDFVCD